MSNLKLKRYYVYSDSGNNEQTEDGDWVSFDDIEPLLNELKKLDTLDEDPHELRRIMKELGIYNGKL